MPRDRLVQRVPSRGDLRIGAGGANWLGTRSPADLQAYLAAVERLGYDFVLVGDRILGVHPDPDGRPRSRFEPDVEVLDPIAVLGYGAATTRHVRLRTAVALVLHRGPVVLAKQAATLDVLSGGRLDLGLGVGWQPEELESTGTADTRRGARLDEALHVMRLLWAGGRVDHHGHFFKLDGVELRPRPVQRPHPPVWLGGTSAGALRRAAEVADGWMAPAWGDLELIERSVLAIRRRARELRESGREPGRAPRFQAAVPMGPSVAGRDILSRIERLRTIGITDIAVFTSHMPGVRDLRDHVAQLERARHELLPAAGIEAARETQGSQVQP